MADTLIHEIPTTATSFASDDYIVLDGVTNGTRNMTQANLKNSVIAGNLATAFSTETTYAVSDLCIKDGQLYICNAAHTAGAWVQSHFEPTSADVVFAKNVSGLLAKKVDYNDVYQLQACSPSTINLQLTSDGVLQEATSTSSLIYYVPVVKGQHIHVTATDSNATGKQFRVGFTTNIPASGETVYGFSELNPTDGNKPVDYSTSAPIDGYFIVLHLATRYSDMQVSVAVPKWAISEEPSDEDSYNTFMYLMNKMADCCGLKKSAWLMPQGSSYTTAKDMVSLACAAIQNVMIPRFWGVSTHDAVVYGDNERIDHVDSTYNDPISHPFVTSLSNYYHIYGGKTGSGTGFPEENYRVRNLVVAVKSKVDTSWLVGCVMHCTGDDDTVSSNRFSVAKDMFDMLEDHRANITVDTSTLGCRSAFAVVLPNDGNINNYNVSELVHISKDSSFVGNSKSMAKLMTLITLISYLHLQELITVKAYDIYGGTGNTYYAGDKLLVQDAVLCMMLPSSNTLARCFGRSVGFQFIQKYRYTPISFAIDKVIAYSLTKRVTWHSWLGSTNYTLWSIKASRTISEVNNVIYIDSNPLLLDGNVVSANDNVVPNGIYTL